MILDDSLSTEFKEFLFSCTKIQPKERPTASELLEFEFITKYKSDKPYRTYKWLREVYLPLKKQNEEEKKLESSKKNTASVTNKSGVTVHKSRGFYSSFFKHFKSKRLNNY
jgi:serine/threonine protein kinase